MTTAESSGSWAALAALLRGPSNERHSRAIAFVRELVAVQARGPRWRWPRWLSARNSGRAVEPVTASSPRGY